MSKMRITIETMDADGTIKVVAQSPFSDRVRSLQSREYACGYEPSVSEPKTVIPTGRRFIEATVGWSNPEEVTAYSAAKAKGDLDFVIPASMRVPYCP